MTRGRTQHGRVAHANVCSGYLCTEALRYDAHSVRFVPPVPAGNTPSRYQRAGARERELDAKWTRSAGAAGEEGEETGCRSAAEGEQKPYMMVRPRTCMVAYRAGERGGGGESIDVGQGKNGIDGVKLW